MTISTIILTKNNQDTLKRLITSLSWCNEIIVIDDQSTDKTPTLARKFGARVFIRPLRSNFAAQRNFALKQAHTDWVLFVDSDEIISPALTREIRAAINRPKFSAYRLQRVDKFLGKILRFGETGHIKLVRLARRTAGRWVRPVHETWQVKGPIGQLHLPLLHQPHPTLTEFLTEINRYTTIEANYRHHLGQRFGLWQALTYPPGKFCLNYFVKLGILDGFPGLIMAIMMSWHSLLVRLKLLRL